MIIGRLDKARKRAFLVGALAEDGEYEMIESMKFESEGRK